MGVAAVLHPKADYDLVPRRKLFVVVKKMMTPNITNMLCLALRSVSITTQWDYGQPFVDR